MNFGLLGTGIAAAHVVGTTRHLQGKEDASHIIKGVSAKRQVLGQKVYNDEGEVVGKVEDLILTKRAVSYAIVSAGGFLRLRTHDVAVGVGEFVRDGERLLLPGASRKAILARPRFEYARLGD